MDLLSKISFKSRLILLISLIVLPLSVLFVQTLYVDLSKIETIEREIGGIAEIKGYSRLIYYLQKHRGLMCIYLRGYESKSLKGRIRRIESEIDSLFLKLEFKHSSQGIKRRLLRLKKEFEGLKLGKVSSSNLSFSSHTEIIEEVMEISKEEGGRYGVLSDPNLFVRTLADTALIEIPKLAEVIGRIRGLGGGILAKGRCTKKGREEIARLYGLLVGYSQVVSWTTKNVKLPEEIISSFKRANEKLKGFIVTVRESFLIGQSPKLDPVDYFNRASVAVDSWFKVHELMLDYLKELLFNKKREILYNLFPKLLSIVLFAIFIIYLVRNIYKVTVGSVLSLLKVAIGIEKGDLNVRAPVLTEDEIGRVAKAFNRAVEKLRETVSILQDYKTAIDRSSVIFKTDPSGTVTYVNKRYVDLSGYSPEEVVGKPITYIFSYYTPEETLKELLSAMERRELWSGRLIGKRKSGERCIVDTTVVPVFKGDGSVLEFVIVCNDVTEIEKSRERLEYLLYHDTVTGLPNRLMLLKDVENLEEPVVCVLDISNFRYLNEFYGEECGDLILKQLAEKLKKRGITRRVYRVFSDEFALLYDLKELGITYNQFLSYFEEIVNSLEEEVFSCNSVEVFLSFFVGVSYGRKKEKLLSKAEIALSEAKERRKKIFGIDERAFEKVNYKNNIELIRKIKRALEERRVVPYYQPIVNNKTLEVEKFEALVRLMDENGQVIPPSQFLEVARRSTLMPQITKRVIEKVVEDFKDVPYGVSINLSFEDLSDKKVVEFILKKINEFPEPKRLGFEILETEEVKNYKLLVNFLKEVKKYGCYFSIDDFGTGYSNFELLMKLDVDYLKIDGSIIKRLKSDGNTRVLVEAIVSFSRQLGIKTIAEFVSDRETFDIVKKIGVNYSQGYYFGKPKPFSKVLNS